MDGWTGRQTDRMRDGQKDRQTQTDRVRHVTWPPTRNSYDRQTGRQTDGLRDRQTDKIKIQNVSSYKLWSYKKIG